MVHGSVLPRVNDRGDDGQTRMCKRHYREIERQSEQRRELRGQYPGTAMVVAGDFNQDRDGSGWYGTHPGRDLLTEAFEAADLACVTTRDVVATPQHCGLPVMRAGVSPEVVSERLGHASVVITLSIYAHVFEQDDQAAAELTARAIFGA